MLFVMCGDSVFSSVLLSLREVSWVCMMCLCSLFNCFSIVVCGVTSLGRIEVVFHPPSR